MVKAQVEKKRSNQRCTYKPSKSKIRVFSSF